MSDQTPLSAPSELPAKEGGLRREGGKARCGWCGDDPVYIAYHDEEWGVPCRDERRLFEMLILECFQTGLAWITILRKRENFRRAFLDWDVQQVANMGSAAQARLLEDAGIIRHAGKIAAAVKNARAFLQVQQEAGSFAEYIWSFTGGKPVCASPRLQSWREAAASTELSARVSKDLKKRGFCFCGPVVVYSYLQAVGVVDDHMAGCWCASRKRAAR